MRTSSLQTLNLVECLPGMEYLSLVLVQGQTDVSFS